MKITLIGTGITAGDLSLGAYNKAKESKKIFLRTALSESGKYILSLGINAEPLDYIYEKSRNFDTLTKNLADKVLKTAKDTEVVYLVDGDVSSDLSCKRIIEKRKGKDVEIINGVSRADAYVSKTNIGGNYLKISAYDLENANLTLPLVVTDIDNSFIAGKVKLAVSNAFGDNIPCYKFVNADFKEMKLYEFDFENDFDYSSALVVPRLDFLHKQRFNFKDLVDIVTALRGENGCPWDKAQTKESVKINLVEECYELIDAINKNDDDGIMEEVGDVLLQAVFQIVFANERGAFDDTDALSGICEKLISRHTHVFGNDKAEKAEDALSVWDKNKQKEKGYADKTEYVSSVPNSLPALLRAEKVVKRAEKCGLDKKTEGEIKKQIIETVEKIEGGDNKIGGELLLLTVTLLKSLGVESEEALSEATERFIDKFAESNGKKQ